METKVTYVLCHWADDASDVIEVFNVLSDAKDYLQILIAGVHCGKVNKDGMGGSYYDPHSEAIIRLRIYRRNE